MNFRYKDLQDPWHELRKERFQNIEPQVQLMTVTGAYPEVTDALPGHVARMSHGTDGKTIEADKDLTTRLLRMQPCAHETPFEFVQWTFMISGVSKSCMTQLDRHRIGAGFVQMSGRYMSREDTGFVYNTYHYVPEKEKVRLQLKADERVIMQAFTRYKRALQFGLTKQDARKSLPLSMATGTYMYMNSRSLRHLFQLRLDLHAEWEIRRLTKMIFDICYAEAPTHFEDIKKTMQK